MESFSDHDDVYQDSEEEHSAYQDCEEKYGDDEDSDYKDALCYVFEDSDCSSSDDFCEHREDISQPDRRDEPLYEGAEHSRMSVMVALLTLCMTHELTKSFTDHLLGLLKLILFK